MCNEEILTVGIDNGKQCCDEKKKGRSSFDAEGLFILSIVDARVSSFLYSNGRKHSTFVTCPTAYTSTLVEEESTFTRASQHIPYFRSSIRACFEKHQSRILSRLAN